MITKKIISVLLGDQSESNNPLQKRMRHHQSWWRTCVMGEEQGLHPIHPENKIGSSILNGEKGKINFIDAYAKKSVDETLDTRGAESKGLIKKDRLFNNLLSSQPLCFNFFGRLKYNLPLATKIFHQFYPDVQEVTDILFEFVPNDASNGDNSAHDVAMLFVNSTGAKGLIGLECKYTEPFSPKEYGKDGPDKKDGKYRKVYEDSFAFLPIYEDLTNTKYNQLFRNQLIIESALLKKESPYKIGYSGLFCFQEDQNAIDKGKAFQKMLKNGEERFKIITFADLIETIQKTEIDWETRDWSMMLWARYCGTELSKRFKE
ncbi:MAG TPA: hypothetical protein VFC67_15585 [Prolixibacteraceae bacterium]|nr:hypothetical protein [Prolixibacteraceae bacterium]